MRVPSLTELLRLSRIELRDQLATLTNAYPYYSDGSLDSGIARHNLQLIRRALVQRPAEPP